jgi:hypothetical protein
LTFIHGRVKTLYWTLPLFFSIPMIGDLKVSSGDFEIKDAIEFGDKACWELTSHRPV